MYRLRTARTEPSQVGTVYAYAAAAGLSAAAVGLRALLAPYLTGAQFITFFPAVIVSAYYFGQRAGLATALLCGLAGWYLFVAPSHSFDLDSSIELVTLIVYFVTAVAIAFLIGTARGAVAQEGRATAALRASEERFRLMADNSPALIWVTDANAQVTFANRRYEEVFGTPADSIEGEGWRNIVHPEDVDAFNAKFLAALADRARFEGEVRVQNQDGEIMWLRCEGVPHFESEVFVGYIGANLDITAAKLAEEQLREFNDMLEQRIAEAVAEHRRLDALYRAYFENSPDSLFVIAVGPDDDFRVEQINPAHEENVGFKAADVVGRRLTEFLPAQEAEKVLPAYRRVRDSREIYQFRDVFQINGEAQHWDTTLLPIADQTGRVVRLIGSSRNITRQIQAEEALRQSQKMEAMGQLTGGVAHDFNNLLTPILGTLEMLQRRAIGSEREQRLIANAMQAAERAATLVQRLLAFARRQPLEVVAVDVGGLVRGMRELFATTVGPQVRLVLELPEGLPPARADPHQLEMALLNLAVNARDAMAGSGTLRIATQAERVTADSRPMGLAEGDYVRLCVIDTGTGMDEATIARAIEPFFSTKGVGKGTGLGLSMAHGLASQLGGALTIASSPGEGATIELWLPASAEPLHEGPALTAQQTLPARRGTALVVDDEVLVRMSTADMLEDLGFEVVEAGSGEEALRLIEEGVRFDILITDHLMPGITGTELAREVRKVRSDVPVLLVSGYAEIDGVPSDMQRLVKPFLKDDLAARLMTLA